MNKKEIVKRKKVLTYQISNIRIDYEGVLREDMPREVVEELGVLMTELRGLQDELAKRDGLKSNAAV